MKTSTLTLGIILLSFCLRAQVAQEWAMRYSNSTFADKAYALALDDSGNVYVTGSSQVTGFGTEDYATVKYNSAGALQWVKRYNWITSDIAHAIVTDKKGNIYVTGESNAAGGASDYLTIKYKHNGDTAWTARLDGAIGGVDIAYSIAVSDSGNVYITGSSEGTGDTHGIFENYVTVKYDSNGVQQWARSYNGPGGDFDAAYSVAVDSSGNVYVTGESGGGSGSSSAPGQDYATIKYNPAGIPLWTKRYNGITTTAEDKANQLKIDKAGNVYVTGKSYGTGSKDYLTIKYKSTGDTSWTARYDGTDAKEDEATALAVDDSGNVYVTGISYSGLTNKNDIITIKYDSSGAQKWVKSYNGTANDNDGGRSIDVDSAGNIYVTGYTTSTTTSSDFATIKYDRAGMLQWSILYTNSNAAGSDDDAVCVKADKAGNVYVTGMSALDYATVKYSKSTVGIAALLPNSFLVSIFPNPSNGIFQIEFTADKSTDVTIELLNVTGQMIYETNRMVKPGKNLVGMGGVSPKLESGMYFCKIQSGESMVVRKVIVQ